MKRLCSICSKDISNRRADALFCSPACKLKRARNEASRAEALARANEVIAVTDKIQADNVDRRPLSSLSREEIQALWDAQLPQTEWIETGTPLDAITLLPKYKISMIYGFPGIGKTTLANMTAANFAGKTLYIDTEASLTSERLEELGIDPRQFTTARLGFIEEVYDLLLDPKTLTKYDLIIWDSVGNTSFRTEVEGDAMDRNMGAKAIIMNKLMRIIPHRLAETDTTLLLVNQERKGLGEYAKNYVPGGVGQMYSSGLVVRLSGTYPAIKVEIKKNRFGNNKDGVIKL